MIYLAPLQGFTDFVYRKAYNQVFAGVDTFFTPYITIKDNKVSGKYLREILPENNLQSKVVPQVLVANINDMQSAAELLINYGYNEINLNMGCPYPMVTNRGKGAGLLPLPEKVREILSIIFEKPNMQLSVKLRSGLFNEKELEQIVPVLNEFPLTEVILHPRIAKQLYAGKISEVAFQFANDNIKHKLVFNGDIFSLEDVKCRSEQFPFISDWMLGRGVLMNPFLPAEVGGQNISDKEKQESLKEFHKLMLESYLEIMDNEGNALNKIKQFWIYFSYNFPNQKKVLKAVKKSRNMQNYRVEVQKAFAQL